MLEGSQSDHSVREALLSFVDTSDSKEKAKPSKTNIE